MNPFKSKKNRAKIAMLSSLIMFVEIMVQFVTNMNKSSGAVASISGAGSVASARSMHVLFS